VIMAADSRYEGNSGVVGHFAFQSLPFPFRFKKKRKKEIANCELEVLAINNSDK